MRGDHGIAFENKSGDLNMLKVEDKQGDFLQTIWKFTPHTNGALATGKAG